MADTQTMEKKDEVIVAPFAFEADHPRNCDLMVQSIPGVRLRSAIDGTKSIIDAKSGETKVPLDQSRYLSSFPKTPGMQLHVNPKRLEYVILDPLAENEKACEQIKSFLNQHGNRVQKIKGQEIQTGKLDMHRMKTLCRELYNMVAAGEGKIVEGVQPKMADIDKLPGHYLLNPGSRVQNTQPVYEKDWDQWVATLSHSGG